jgi:outer membrane protein TolC
MAAQQARFEAGSSSQAELSNFRMSVEEAQLAADRAEEAFGYSKRVFARLVGMDVLDDESIPLLLPHPEYLAPKADAILAGFVGQGIESTFQREVYRTIIKQQELNYSVQKVRLLPKVSAVASYNLSNNTYPAPGHVQQVALTQENYEILASWTIFDGFATHGAKLQALATKRQYERILQTYVDNTVDQITSMRHQIGFSARALSLAEVHHNLIEAEVKRLGEDKNLGYASQATIDTGVLNLYGTEYQVAVARTDYLSQWSEFISLAGIDPALANISPRYVR